VHVHLCRYIDDGKNPQLYTKDCMEKALAKNEAVKGKIDVLKVCVCRRIVVNDHVNVCHDFVRNANIFQTIIVTFILFLCLGVFLRCLRNADFAISVRLSTPFSTDTDTPIFCCQ